MLPKYTCPVCLSTDIISVVEIRQVPIHCNLLWSSRQAAIQASRGDIELGFCRDCGHLFNLAFNPELMEYTQAYENSLHFSPRFQRYAELLAAQLVERYALYEKDIIEIGSGKGDFLKLLSKMGQNRCVGFDPSYVPDRTQEASSELITFIQDFYSERYAGYQADLICCRHVLEHIQFPRDFLKSVRQSIGERFETVVFFEVPNAMYTLKDLGVWDLIYEHCSYFSASSLSHLFSLSEFEVHQLAETYQGQFLGLEAKPRRSLDNLAANSSDALPEMTGYVTAFADKYRNKVQSWKRGLEQMVQDRQQVVVWGSGSKGVTFLNILQTQQLVEYIVDINPRKHGMYVAGTGQQIVPPEFLQKNPPDVIIVMNPIYKAEIQQIVNNLGLSPQFMDA